MRKKLLVLLFFGLFFVLSYNIMQMPGKSSVDAPSYNDTVHYYIEHSLEETGAINIVASVLADYRAFDTLGETIVLFTSIVAVASILKVTDNKKDDSDDEVSDYE